MASSHAPSPTGHVVPHHFESAQQAFESSKLGLWVFLVTEILLFSVLFLAYIVLRGSYPEAFHEASKHLDPMMGGVNTVVLICSSFSMAMAVQMTKENRRKIASLLLVFTLLCAAGFMVVKFMEYSHKIHDGLLPGKYFTNKEIHDPKAALFFSIYFMMTGVHGIHVLVGMGLITWVLFKTLRNKVGSDYYTPTELTGLYWHLVDLVWIFLFPLLYLVG